MAIASPPAPPASPALVGAAPDVPRPPRVPRVPRLPLLRRLGVRALQSMLGVVVALALTECAFRVRDHGAFPHLNVYVADAKLGVRLRPGATERVAFDGNPASDVRINANGYRGADLPSASEDEILVVGDSQVFGLGVQESETFSARLAERTGRVVINAGVPTYGPPEYEAVVAETFLSRRPRTVVFVVNFANDLFEANRPNVDRHAVWDGWAVRKDTAPERVAAFPGRALLYRESHAFYAMRAWWHRNDEPLDERGFASEGSWHDLVAASHAAQVEGRDAGSHVDPTESDRWAAEMKDAIDREVAAQQQLEDLAAKSFPDIMATKLGAEYQRSHGNPGDILVTERRASQSESARPTEYTVRSLIEGAEVRRRIEDLMRKRAEKEREKASGQAVLASFDQRRAIEQRIAELQSASLDLVRASSPLAPVINRVKDLCDAHGARLVVVALPLDVQVSSSEWAKYGAAPVDMSATKLLIDDLVATSESLGVTTLDATPILAAAEPGAFLFGDIHMTPKGHLALAEALATKLLEPAPSVLTRTLPAGRSRVPIAAEWTTATPTHAKSTPAGCRAVRLREWMRITCVASNAAQGAPSEVALVKGGHGEAMVLHAREVTTVVAPVFPGDELVVDLAWGKPVRRWRVRWKKGAPAPSDSFASVKAIHVAPRPDDEAAALCACHASTDGEASCASLVAAPDVDCARTYGARDAKGCAQLLACSAGDPSRPPRCLDGFLHAGAAQHCYRRCSATAPCELGACTDWQGVAVCM